MLHIRALGLFAFALGSAAMAQTGLATLTGVVTDPSNAAVANAIVRATHVDTGTVLTGTTSATGNYAITQMPIGRYSLSVEFSGFKTYRREGLTLSAAQVLGGA